MGDRGLPRRPLCPVRCARRGRGPGRSHGTGGALTLRRRLTLLVALAVVVPITAVGVTVVDLISTEVGQRAFDRLRQAASVAQSSIQQQEQQVARQVRSRADDDLALLVATGGSDLDGAIRRMLDDEDFDVVVVTDGTGAIAASGRRQPAFAAGVSPPTDEDLLAGRARGRAVLARAALPTPPDGRRETSPIAAVGGGELVAGQWLDGARLSRISRFADVDLLVVSGREVLATTGTGSSLPDRPLEGEFEARVGGVASLVVATQLAGSEATVLAIGRPPIETRRTNLIVIFGALLVVIVVLIVLVGYVVSGLVTGPVDDLVDAALAVARGDLDQRVDVKGDVEVATLGRAFNRMTDNLREYVHQLEQSRTEFRQAIARLGDVLVSTHDLPGIIDVVLETSALTLRADVAVFYERVAMPARVRATASHGGDVTGTELNATGVAGTAARHLMPVSHPGAAALAHEEPQVAAAAAVPVISEGRLFGVLAVYGKQDGLFRAEDLDTLQTLARQAEVAIGNVMLHDETRRQARTDGTTGLWNRREFELRCREAVKEAARFNEPFGVMLVDIDDFKQVNDRYDHSTGDAALIWVATKLSEATREVDVVARWGGEEFIVLLPRAGLEETALVADRVRRAVAREPMQEDGKVIPLTVSVGYAGHPEDGTTAEKLFRAADAGLLRAKRMGKNRVERAEGEERAMAARGVDGPPTPEEAGVGPRRGEGLTSAAGDGPSAVGERPGRMTEHVPSSFEDGER
jgi:two-component system cell cycle response regulator